MPAKKSKNFVARIEKGFTRIPNILFDAIICSNLNITQKDMCYYLIRRSFGWGKHYAAISLNDFAFVCGSFKPYISTQLKELQKKRVVIKYGKLRDQKTVYGMNPDIAQWDKSCIDLNYFSNFINTGSTKRLYPDITPGLFPDETSGLYSDITPGLYPDVTSGLYPDITPGLYPDVTSQADSGLEEAELQTPVNKDIKKEKESILYCEDSPPYKLSALLLQYILKHLPNYKKPNLQRWSEIMDKMMRIDNRDYDEIVKVILFTQQDEFWRSNVLSANKLRKQYDTLNAKRLIKMKYSRDYNLEGGDESEYSFFFDK